jgi:hypothetical protein
MEVDSDGLPAYATHSAWIQSSGTCSCACGISSGSGMLPYLDLGAVMDPSKSLASPSRLSKKRD